MAVYGAGITDERGVSGSREFGGRFAGGSGGGILVAVAADVDDGDGVRDTVVVGEVRGGDGKAFGGAV